MKQNRHNIIFKQVGKIIHESLTSCFPDSPLSLEDIYREIKSPPNPDLGHLTFACFPLAKHLKMAPPQIAQKLLPHLQTTALVTKVQAKGPYINFLLAPKRLGELVVASILSEDYFRPKIFLDAPKTMIEYSQPNTHKILHVGHMRNLCLGNALDKIFDYCGLPVISATYPGDVGTHVAKTLWYIKNRYEGEIPETNQGQWLGSIYTLATNQLEKEIGTPKEMQNKETLTQILKEIHDKEGDYFKLWQKTREWSLNLMKEAYAWSEVNFDKWFFESEVDAHSLQLTKEFLQKGLLIESEGAVGMDLREDNLGFCMLIKSDGTGNYGCKDVALALTKFMDFNIERSIYIVDERQSYHFRQVFKVLEKLGFKEAFNCYHLKYEMVELPDGAMSSRKGNIIPLMELIHKMEDLIITKYLEKYRQEWGDALIEETAKSIANGAIKYGMLRMDPNRKIVFNMEEWLRLDGETGPYLQYVHARIQSLEEKIKEPKDPSFQWSLLNHPAEVALMVKLVHFNSIVEESCLQYKPSHLTSYLYELGKLFNNFYAECSIAKALGGLKMGQICSGKICPEEHEQRAFSTRNSCSPKNVSP